MFSPILRHCHWRPEPEPGQNPPRSIFQIYFVPACLPYTQRSSVFLICITSSILPMPFLLFPYPLLHSPPDIPYSICPHPPASIYPYTPFFSRTLRDISHLSSCSIFQPDSFPLPVIPVDFDSPSTLNSNDPNLPISSTSHHLPALFPHLYKLVWCTVQVYILCNVFTYTVYTILKHRRLQTCRLLSWDTRTRYNCLLPRG